VTKALRRPTTLTVALAAGLALPVALPDAAFAATYYVATTGSDTAVGSESAPFASVVKANAVAVAGDTVYIRGGTYKITDGTNSCTSETSTVDAIALSKSGTAGNVIKYWAAPGETPVFDYSNLMANCRVKGFLVSGSYIHMKGIEVTGVKQRNQANHESWGVWISGSNNLLELLNIHHIDGTGLFIAKGGNNLVLNCDSHHNFDPLTSNGACESGDGFGAHVTAGGKGNVFRGCRGWFNADDDFDLINAFESVTIENCWAWHAGYRYDTGASCGNGNGIKSGGYGTDTSTFPANPPVHVIRGNLAVGNKAAGFYANHHPGNITFYNNTGYANHPNFNMLGMDTSGKDITVGTYRNNLAIGGTATSNANNPDDDNNSWTLSVTANDADLQLISEAGLDGPRQADGSLPQITNYHLVVGSDLIDKGVDVGLEFAGAKPDLGCFESGISSTAAGGSAATGGVGSAGRTSTGGSLNSGGNVARGGGMSAAGKASGGTSTASSAGGSSARGGATSSTAGQSSGASASGGSSVGRGGAVATSSAVNSPIQGGSPTGSNQTSAVGTATVDGSGGAATSVGSSERAGSAAQPNPPTTGSQNNAGDGSDPSGCNCRVNPRTTPSVAGLAGLLLLGLVVRRRRKAAGGERRFDATRCHD
jgi:MYXO-CTERM domain-containing protein